MPKIAKDRHINTAISNGYHGEDPNTLNNAVDSNTPSLLTSKTGPRTTQSKGNKGINVKIQKH